MGAIDERVGVLENSLWNSGQSQAASTPPSRGSRGVIPTSLGVLVPREAPTAAGSAAGLQVQVPLQPVILGMGRGKGVVTSPSLEGGYQPQQTMVETMLQMPSQFGVPVGDPFRGRTKISKEELEKDKKHQAEVLHPSMSQSQGSSSNQFTMMQRVTQVSDGSVRTEYPPVTHMFMMESASRAASEEEIQPLAQPHFQQWEGTPVVQGDRFTTPPKWGLHTPAGGWGWHPTLFLTQWHMLLMPEPMGVGVFQHSGLGHSILPLPQGGGHSLEGGGAPQCRCFQPGRGWEVPHEKGIGQV